MPIRIENEHERAFLQFVDQEACSIVQALHMAADANDRNADECEGPFPNIAPLFRESAASFRAKAVRFDELFDRLPMQED